MMKRAFSQNSYILKTGKTLIILNQLPDTLKPYFDEQVLVERYGKFTSAADYRIGIAAQQEAINLMFMKPKFNPEDFKKVFYPRTQYPYMLNVRIPGIYMDQLNYWYNNSYIKMPADLKRTVNNYTVTIQALFNKGDHYLLFTGDKSSSTFILYTFQRTRLLERRRPAISYSSSSRRFQSNSQLRGGYL